MAGPSQNVLMAQMNGCRCTRFTNGLFCYKPVIEVPNATMCESCFQLHHQDLMHSLGRKWCLNHGNGCFSEKEDYVPLPGIQSYIPPGRPGVSFKESGFCMLGHYCAACSLWNVVHSTERAEEANAVPVYTKERKRTRSQSESEILIEQLQHLPNKTAQQTEALTKATEIHLRLKLREKKLKEDQKGLETVLKDLASVIVPTDDGD